MLQPILAGGEDCHRLAEIRQTLFLAKQTADAQRGAERTLTTDGASLVDILLNEAPGLIVLAQGRVNQGSLRPPWRRSGIDESVSGGQALDSLEIS